MTNETESSNNDKEEQPSVSKPSPNDLAHDPESLGRDDSKGDPIGQAEEDNKIRNLRAKRNKILALVMVLLLVTAGAVIAALLLSPSKRELDLEAARALWAKHGLQTYNYTYRQSCFCVEFLDDTLIQVVDGKALFGPTLDDLFARVGRVIRNEILDGVEYDPKYGYPTWISIVYKNGIADGDSTTWAKLHEV